MTAGRADDQTLSSERAHIFDAIGIPASVWDADGRLADLNRAFAEKFGALGAEMLKPGVSRDAVFDRLNDSGLLVVALKRPAAGDPLADQTLVMTDGRIFRVESWPARNGATATLFLDITDSWRAQRSLERARDTAAEADQSKSRFLRAANHDLRQPLASLKLLIYACMSAETEDQRQEALHAMDLSVAIMEDLLGALLNVGQLDAGRIKPQINTFQVSTVLERLRVQFDQLARDKGVELRVIPTSSAVVSDRALLERILSNFVANAIRYTDMGKVLVGCRHDGNVLRIEVHDTGVGIAAEHQERIFQEFYRVGGQRSARHSLGLGLNIAHRLAEMLEHPIRLNSVLGKGSTFSLEVPVGNVWHSTLGETEISERIGGEFAGLTCLVLEDDPNLREALTTLLERWGMVTFTMTDFDSVSATLTEMPNPPDVIITDYHLRGGLTGMDVVHQINDILEMPCPAIVVTADVSPGLVDEIRSQGFPVLIKPVSPPGLRVVMHNILFEPELVEELS